MDFCKSALNVIEIEAQAVSALANRIDINFEKACHHLLHCQGRVVITGMGKSGHIGRKIAATLSSTGTPSFYMHPAEANHGDLGMLTKQDVVIAISYSGQTNDVITLLPLIKRFAIPLITLTGNKESILAEAADINLDISVQQEACPLGLAPTTSTTVALVMGDAIAIALLEARGFSAEDFALAHPGGSLGKRLLLKVDDLYHDGDELPMVNESDFVNDALIVVTEKKLGMTCVVNSEGVLSGIYTDGDIRRTLTQNRDIKTTRINEVMTQNCLTIPQGTLAAEALRIMQQYKITSLVIINPQQHPIAVIHLHDLLRSGII